MKILIDSYNTVFQRGGGGIPMRVATIYEGISKQGVEVKLFDKWKDKISDYDVLHIFKANIDSYSEIMYAKKCGVKVVLSSVVPQESRLKIILGMFLHKLFRINNTYSYIRLMLVNSDRVIAQTNKERQFIKKFFCVPEQKIIVLPNGINQTVVDSYSPEIKKDIILCVGRFDKNKNQLGLIRAMKGSGLPVHFIGGSVPEEETYYHQCLEEAGADSNFVFHGWLKSGSKELVSLYQRAKVCVLISFKEIFGNVIVEGAACGSNLVVTKSLPVEEYGFNTNCSIVDPYNIQDIRAAVISEFNEPLTDKLRKVAIENFSWKTIIKKHIELYDQLFENKNDIG